MDKIVSINSKKSKPISPIHLVALIDLILFALLSFKSGSFVPLTLILGVSKATLNYLSYYILRKFKLGDRYIFLIVALILSFGLAMQLRLSTEIGIKQFIWFLIGISLFMLISSGYKIMHKYIRSIWFFYALIIFLFIMTQMIGVRINGAKNWIMLGKFSFQPSEFIKIIFVFFMASFISNSEALRLKIADRVLPPKWTLMVMVFVVLGFFVLQREFGTALLIFMVYLAIVYVFEKAAVFIALNAVFASLGAIVAIQIMPHLQARIDSWLNPYADIAGKGYQITQSLFAIGSGSFFGTGLGLGYPHFIPNVETDFIFSAICEEMGLFGGLAIIILFALLVYRGIKICLRLRDPFSKSLAFGLTTTIGFQTLIIIGGVTKAIPLTGITLPFVSYGGSSLISSFLILGILQALSGSILTEEVFEVEKIDNE